MTFNVRFDDVDARGVRAWEHRREILLDAISAEDPDVLCLQETVSARGYELTTNRVLPWITGSLIGYETAGGDCEPVFYRAARFDAVESGCMLLPEVAGRAHQVARTVTWVRLCDRQTGERFYVYNTHLTDGIDRPSVAARNESARVIAAAVSSRGFADPVILTGDLNAPRGSRAVRIIRAELEDCGPSGPLGTYHAFSGTAIPVKIDYIFVSRGLAVLDCRITRFQEGRVYPSDHFPLVARIRFG
jgi:endonuclease/exonuclease/phosphatase family metal-dependent hydrolase